MHEIILSVAHITLIVAWATFITAQTALLRPAWLNAAVLPRLIRLNYLALLCAVLLLVSGLARLFVGAKPWAFYLPQYALHIKLILFVLMLGMGWMPLRAYRLWQKQWAVDLTLPTEFMQNRARTWLMWQSHLFVVLIVLGACLARGVF